MISIIRWTQGHQDTGLWPRVVFGLRHYRHCAKDLGKKRGLRNKEINRKFWEELIA
jgi:hypothetical protein